MEEKEVKVEEVSLDDAAGVANNDVNVNAGAKCNAANPADGDKCENQVETLIAQVRELNDKYLRMAAELEKAWRARVQCRLREKYCRLWTQWMPH